jgi:hypothetical protein
VITHTVVRLEQRLRSVLNINASFAKANRISRLMPARRVLRKCTLPKAADAVPNWGNSRGQPVLASHETPLLHPDFLEDDVTGG